MASEGKLTYPDGSDIYYKKREATKQGYPGIVFCSGYGYSTNESKACFVDDYCAKKGLSCVRFDYIGHELSSGTKDDISTSCAKQNTLDVVDKLTEGPQVIVGYSLGGRVAILAGIERPTRIFALVSIANGTDLMYRRYCDYTPEKKKEVEKLGYLTIFEKADGVAENVPWTFFIDSNKHLLLESNEIPIACPVRLLHGMNDDVVPYETSLEIARKLQSEDVEVYLDKKADHGFSSDKNLKLLGTVLDELVELWSHDSKTFVFYQISEKNYIFEIFFISKAQFTTSNSDEKLVRFFTSYTMTYT